MQAELIGVIGDSVIPGLGSILGAIGGLLGGILGGGGSSLPAVQAALSSIGQELTNGLQVIGSALELLFTTIIPQFLKRLWDALKDLAGLIAKAMGDLQKILQWIRAVHDYLFRNFIAPILQVIQMLRGYLVLLRLLHVKFAVQLDQTLAGIEAEIYGKFQLAFSQLNKLTSWAQLITNSTGVLSHDPLFGALTGNLAELRQLTGLNPAAPLNPAAAAQVSIDTGFFDTSAVDSRAVQWANGTTPSVLAVYQSNIRTQLSGIRAA